MLYMLYLQLLSPLPVPGGECLVVTGPCQHGLGQGAGQGRARLPRERGGGGGLVNRDS